VTPHTLDLAAAARALGEGSLSAEALVADCLARIDECEPGVHAWAHLDRAGALARARRCDRAAGRGGITSPLHGIPIGIKDIIDTAGMPTEYGCPVFAGRVPARDAWLVSRLLEAGAVLPGKTVTAEMATFSPGPTANPHDPGRTPGGSSSGSAAAVAASMLPGAIGSQTVGSMIRPASFCGIHGFKPSYGLIPRHGVLKQSPFLDQIGVFARTLVDTAFLAEALVGSHPGDPATCVHRPRPALVQAATAVPARAPRFVLIRTPVWDQAEAATRRGLEEIAAALGRQAGEAELPAAFEQVWDWRTCINEADIAANYAPLLEGAMDRISDSLRGQMERGGSRLAVDYARALQMRQWLNRQLERVFDDCDAIITPSAPGEAPAGLQSTGNPVFCAPWTFAGVPAINLPLLKGDTGLPIGVQVVGRLGGDAGLLRSARWLEQAMLPEAA